MWVCGGVHCQEATPSCVCIRYHLDEHLVARGDEGARSESPAETSEALSTSMPAVNVHVVVATEVVILQVDEAEGEDNNFALRNLTTEKTCSLCHVMCNRYQSN